MSDNVVQVTVKADDRASGELNKLGGNLKALTGLITAMAAAATAAAVALFKMSAQAAENNDKLNKHAQITGETVENLSRLAFAADQSKTSFDTAAKGLLLLSRGLFDAKEGIGEAKIALDAMDIAFEDNEGQLRSSLEVLIEAADNFAAMEDGTEKAALAIKLFGKAGADLIPLLNAGSAGLRAYFEEADRVGITVSKTAAILGEQYIDAMGQVNLQLDGLRSRLSESVLPVMIDLVKRLQDVLTASADWIRENRVLVRTIFQVGIRAAVLLTVILSLVSALTAAKLAMVAFGVSAKTVVATSGPIGLAIIALGALATASIWAREKMKEPFTLGALDLSSIDTARNRLAELLEAKEETERELARLTTVAEQPEQTRRAQDDGEVRATAAGNIEMARRKQAIASANSELAKQKIILDQINSTIEDIQPFVEAYDKAMASANASGKETGMSMSEIRADLEAAADEAERFEHAFKGAGVIGGDLSVEEMTALQQEAIDKIAAGLEKLTEIEITPLSETFTIEDEVFEMLEQMGVDIEALNEKLIEAGTTVTEFEGILIAAFEAAGVAARQALDPLANLIADLTNAAVNFAMGVADSFGRLFTSILVDGQNAFQSLGAFIKSVGQFIKQLVTDLIAAIAKAIILKIILGATTGGAGFFFSGGGEVARGQRGFEIAGNAGPDNTLALLASKEVVLPTVGGIYPGELLRGLFDLKDKVASGARGGGDVTINQSWEIAAMNVDSVREELRTGTMRREQARAAELGRT